MLRLDYMKQENGTVEVKVVSETENTHALCGRLVLSTEEWEFIWKALGLYDTPDTWDHKESFVKFENKGVDQNSVEPTKV